MFARRVQIWDGFGMATVIFGHIFKFEHLRLGGKLKCTVIRGPYCGHYCFRAVTRGNGGLIICRTSIISPKIAQGTTGQGLIGTVKCHGKAKWRLLFRNRCL